MFSTQAVGDGGCAEVPGASQRVSPRGRTPGTSSTLWRTRSRTLESTPTWAGTMGAGDGNRTRMTSLEGWGSAIELRPRDLPGAVGAGRSSPVAYRFLPPARTGRSRQARAGGPRLSPFPSRDRMGGWDNRSRYRGPSGERRHSRHSRRKGDTEYVRDTLRADRRHRTGRDGP